MARQARSDIISCEIASAKPNQADLERGYLMPTGTIRRLFAGTRFGSIQTAEGEDLFFDTKELQGADHDSIREGQQVEFEVGEGSDGRPQAITVRLVQPKGG